MHTTPPPILLADAKGLDFLNSIATPVDESVEWLSSGKDLLAWLRASGLAPTEVLSEVEKKASVRALDEVAADARELREWFRKFVQAHKGKPLSPSALRDLELLNKILSQSENYGQLVVENGVIAWKDETRWRGPRSLLQPIALAIAKVICDEDFSLVRACEGHNCTLVFVDRTKSHRRRWCSMAVCGNRAKQSAHRERGHLETTRPRVKNKS